MDFFGIISKLTEKLAPPVEKRETGDGREIFFCREDYESYEPAKMEKHSVVLENLPAVVAWIQAIWEEHGFAGWLFWTPRGLAYHPDKDYFPMLAPATFAFPATPEAKMWGFPDLKLDISQKAFKTLLETSCNLPDENVIVDRAAEWLEVATNIKYISSQTTEKKVEAFGGQRVAYENKSGVGKDMKIPEYLDIAMPLIEGLEVSFFVKFRPEFYSPAPGQVFIKLECLTAERLVAGAVEEAVAWIEKQVKAADNPPPIKVFRGQHL